MPNIFPIPGKNKAKLQQTIQATIVKLEQRAKRLAKPIERTTDEFDEQRENEIAEQVYQEGNDEPA